MIRTWLDPLPLVAILRGIQPSEVLDVGHALVDAGFRIIEVPMNSPEPLDSIRRLSSALGESCLIGAAPCCTSTRWRRSPPRAAV
jgi:2-dehydro-3-deoxyphosphogalactonate aldolase